MLFKKIAVAACKFPQSLYLLDKRLRIEERAGGFEIERDRNTV